jgi:hypothetical protein
MNTIRAKIIVSWLLFLTGVSLLCFHHLFIACCAFGIESLVRNTKPKAPQLPQRIGYILSFVVIAFLVLALIGSYYPFPPSIHIAENILAVLIFWPFLFYLAYLDYKAFKTTHDLPDTHPKL